MDKFGIFNLLNSFFPLSEKKNEQSSNNISNQNNLLSTLFSSLSKGQSSSDNKTQTNQTASLPPHPLQEQMLLTVTNHDALVKRVKKGQKNF